MHEAAPRDHAFGLRGRMDERCHCVRSVCDQRFIYIRNYMPHKIYGQRIAYMFETPTTSVWKGLYDEGKLNGQQRAFWEPKPPEELYDLAADRDEVRNLAASPRHARALRDLRQAHRQHSIRIRDIGLPPEAERHARANGGGPFDMPFEAGRVLAAAESASIGELNPALLDDADSGVRYWGAMGFLIRKKSAPARLLQDPSPSVRIAAAESRILYARRGDVRPAMQILFTLADSVNNGPHVALQALAAIVAADPRVPPNTSGRSAGRSPGVKRQRMVKPS